MEGLAQVLVQGGMVVTATALSTSPAAARLRQLGIRVHADHSLRSCTRTTHRLVCDADTSRVDPLRLAARRRGLPVHTPAECLGALLRRGIGLALTGGRDASMAAAMIGWTLTQSGRDPTVVLARAAAQLGGWARLGQGPHVVVDAMIGGVRTDWGVLAPKIAVVLDDPGDRAPGADNEPWRSCSESLPDEGWILARPGNTAAQEASRRSRRAVEWLALEPGYDWWGADLRGERARLRFRVFCKGRYVTELRLRVPGRRNVLCALAAVAACTRLGVPSTEIQQALEEFTGVSRDFESRGSYRGVTLVDDAGGDPAAVGEALRLARQVFGDRRLWAVLALPVGVLDLEEESRYAAALAPADEVVLVRETPGRSEFSLLPSSPSTTAARMDTSNGVAGEALVLEGTVTAAGIRALSVAGLDAALWELDRQLEPGDVLVTLGAGDVGMISDAFIRRLSRDRPG
jgi:UDP-N-acetylmuramate--alanine ligase